MVDITPAAIGPLWIRRQVFEHSVAVPLLTSSTASQIDFSRLTAELLSVATGTHCNPPAVTYDAWVAAAGLHALLDSSEDAGIIIEALETNAPDAFVACNDPDKLAPGRQLNYRHLFIPVPELLAFIKLHAAATISSRFRESADAVWPDQDASGAPLSSPTSSPIPFSIGPSARHASSQSPSHVSSPSPSPPSPRITSQGGGHQQTPPSGNSAPDTLVRKKTPTHLGALTNKRSAIIASMQHAFQRETRLILSNIKSLLLIIASVYGVRPDISQQTETTGVDTHAGMGSGGGTVAAESGSLSRDNLQNRVRRANSLTSGSDVSLLDESAKTAVKNLPIAREMFEHLSFLLTTICEPSGSYRPISWIVPQWRDSASTATVSLGELVDIVTTALTGDSLNPEFEGFTDVAEIRDLDRRTILRSSIPNTNSGTSQYPHAKEVRISNCSESHFYLRCSLGRVSLIACKDCTLFVSACVSVSLINCDNVRLHAIARVCRVTNCFDTHLYLCTNRYPQIVGENRGLIFAPYNASYDVEEAKKHLAAVGVDPSANVWDKFYRPAYRSSSLDRTDPDLTPVVASALAPELFLPFAVPIRASEGRDNGEHMQSVSDNEGERDASSRALFTVAVPLPAAYQAQLTWRSAEIGMIRKEIREFEKKHAVLGSTIQKPVEGEEDDTQSDSKDVPMSDDACSPPRKSENEDTQDTSLPIRRGLLQSLVQEKFREWLNHSGRIRQINDLVRLDQEA